jgi:beta-glucosidase
MTRKTKLFVASLLACAIGTSPTQAQVAHPAQWPAVTSGLRPDPAVEQQITAMLARMSLEEKIGQMIQADLSTIRPEDLRRYPLGSILAGGSTPPLDAPDRSPIGPWVATARAFRAVAMEARPGHVPIPLIFGIDAVHGNNNVVGATLFPQHCLGRGARSRSRAPHRPGHCAGNRRSRYRLGVRPHARRAAERSLGPHL